MTFVHYQDCVSPHQLPLAREIAKRVGEANFRYVYRDADQAGRSGMGWDMRAHEQWCVHQGTDPEGTQNLLEHAEVMLTGMRDVDLFERRSAKGLLTFYQTERWFKPIHGLPGKLRLFVPTYRRMVRRFVRLAQTSECLKVLPIGVHAFREMEQLGVPKEKMVLWGYFVAPSTRHGDLVHGEHEERGEGELRHETSPGSQCSPWKTILYVGRLLKLKRVDTIIRAVRLLNDSHVSLTIVGDGPEKAHLQRLASGLNVTFRPPIPIAEVRQTMREHDVLVFASNAVEGWGAVVSEALEEGLIVFASRETGAGATLLPSNRQFKSGDVHALADLLARAARGEFRPQGIGEWSAAKAAGRLTY